MNTTKKQYDIHGLEIPPGGKYWAYRCLHCRDVMPDVRGDAGYMLCHGGRCRKAHNKE